MAYNKEIIEFWQNDDFKNITAGAKQFPEGWDVRELLSDIIKDDDVIEVGCGYGRLVNSFKPENYTGVDINPFAIEKAVATNTEYVFNNFNVDDILGKSTWLMFYTVLLHINHEDISAYLSNITQNTDKVLVAEILGKERWGNVWEYAFNRDIEDYDILFESCGFKRTQLIEKPYEHYKNTNISFIVYEK